MRSHIYSKYSALVAALALVVMFQNCTKDYAITTSGVPGLASSSGTLGNTGSTPTTLNAIQPAFAVRGMNCVACHAVFGSNVITDFGYPSSNFDPLQNPINNLAAPAGTPVPFFSSSSASNGRTAYNDSGDDAGEPIGGWQNATINGNVLVPKVALTQTEITQLGLPLSLPASLANLFTLVPPGSGPQTNMLGGSPSSTKVIEVSSVTISYPGASDFAALLQQAGLTSGTPHFNSVTLPNFPTSQISGFKVNAAGYVYNDSSQGPTQCIGDIVVEGPLFLDNLQLQTNAGGCRLYVDGTVFIQGPVTYVGAVNHSQGANLQISSDVAVMLGLSAARMGAYISGQGSNSVMPSGKYSTVRVDGSEDNLGILKAQETHASCEWTRFDTSDETELNPSGDPINGYAGHAYFDKIVTDALLIGSQLQSASNVTYVQQMQAALQAGTAGAGVSLVNDDDSTLCPDFQATVTPSSLTSMRVHINYDGLLLNAPHVHSFYGGTLNGVVIAEVAFLARNIPTSSTPFTQFTFDPELNQTVNASVRILPALRDVLIVTP
jgi:hypothetical protein